MSPCLRFYYIFMFNLRQSIANFHYVRFIYMMSGEVLALLMNLLFFLLILVVKHFQ